MPTCRCSVCDGTGKYFVEFEDKKTLYLCENCEGKGFLDELDPRIIVRKPKWV